MNHSKMGSSPNPPFEASARLSVASSWRVYSDTMTCSINSFPLRILLLGLGLYAYHVAAAAASAGCARTQSVKVGQTTNVTIDGRWYLLYIPEQYKATSPAPLILSYHGGNRNASEQQSLDLLSTPFFNEEYIVVYPNGIDVSLTTSSLLVSFELTVLFPS